MISPHLRIDHFDPAEWKHAHRLLVPPPPHGRASRPPSPPLLLFVDEGRVVKALRLVAGASDGTPPGLVRVDPASFGWAGPWSLGKLRRAVGAKFAVALEGDVLDRLAAAIDGSLGAGDDLVAQGLACARAARAELGKGIHVDPDPFSALPVPSYGALQQTFDVLLPDDRAGGLFLYDRDGAAERIWTSLILEKRGGDVVRLTSHRALGLATMDYRGGRHRAVLDAMARHVAPPSVALFASLDAWRDVVGPDPGALARQLALREAVLDPAPAWLVALTGATAMAGVAQEASRLFGRFIPQSIKDTARALSVSPFTALGFDPLALFTQLRDLF